MSTRLLRTAAPSTGLTKEQEEKLTGVPTGGAEHTVLRKKTAANYDDEWATISNDSIVAAAGIEESKLSIPEMVKLTGEQTLTGRKNFETPQPAENAEAIGTTSAVPLNVKSGQGGTTSNAGASPSGGNSGPVELLSGTGGAGPANATTTSTAGNSGNFNMKSGIGGEAKSATPAKNQGGRSGEGTYLTGAGGNAAGATATSNTGGPSGDWKAGSGQGGSGKSSLGTNQGAASGQVSLATGTGGAATGGKKAIGGSAGPVIIKSGGGGSGSGGSETSTNGSGGPVRIVLGAGGNLEESKSGPFEIRYKEAAGAIRFYIHPEGNVGIGNTETPAYKLDVREGDIAAGTVGKGFRVKEGENARMGAATLEAGKVVVATTAVTANSRIFLTINEGGLLNVGVPYEAERIAGTSFTIKSSNALDASTVAWLIMEPA